MTRTPFGALIVLALALAFAAMWPFRGDLAQSVALTTMMRPLAHAKSWRFVPNPFLAGESVGTLASDRSDLLVAGDKIGLNGTALTAGDVAALQSRPGMRSRLVLAHIDLTTISERDVYWDAVWSVARPGWFDAPLCDTRETYPVKFWVEDWRKLIFSAPGSYLDRVTDLGFDGVYLDGLARLDDLQGVHPSTKRDMIRFVTEIAAKARAKRPGFIVMIQAEPSILDDPSLRNAIDGVGIEGGLYGADGLQRRQASDIVQMYEALRPLQNEGKPVFAVEFAMAGDFVNRAAVELRRRGIVPGSERSETQTSRAHDCGTEAARN